MLAADAGMDARPVRFLIYGGDSMLGRAVNLTLPWQSPGDEVVTDSCMASHYLQMALHGGEQEAGELQRMRQENADGSRLWGDLLHLRFDPPPDVRLLNLETAVTETITNKDIPNKGINYHMHSNNVAALTSLSSTRHGAIDNVPYVLSFANNHSMDFGRQAFEAESLPRLRALPGQGQMIGAGINLTEATKPAILSARDTTVRVFGFASACSGTPRNWAASDSHSGIAWLPEVFDADSADRAFEVCRRAVEAAPTHRSKSGKQRALLVFSIHWGPNWAYSHPGDGQAYRRRLAHRLVDELGVDLVYGHSSHHVRGLEVHSGRLIMYGAGDLVNDYEGFKNAGEEMYSCLGGVFAVDVAPGTGRVSSVLVVPVAMDRLSVRRVVPSGSLWDPLARRRRPSGGDVEDLARKLNALSVRDAGSTASAPCLKVRHSSADVGILPAGPVLVWEA